MRSDTGTIVAAVLTTLALAGVALAQDGIGTQWPLCDPVGTWVGQNETHGTEFVVTFQPLGGGRYSMVSEGHEVPLPYERQTPWRGEMRKTGRHTYRIAEIAIGSPSQLTDPGEGLPDIAGISGEITLVDCDHIEMNFDPLGVYAWGQIPFVDEPLATWPPSFGTYVRVPAPGPPRETADRSSVD